MLQRSGVSNVRRTPAATPITAHSQQFSQHVSDRQADKLIVVALLAVALTTGFHRRIGSSSRLFASRPWILIERS